MEKRKHIVILAAGTFPTHRVPLQALREADMVVCCDSAYHAFRQSPFATLDHVVVGDADSLGAADIALLGNRYIVSTEQDDNDLTKAYHWVRERYGSDNCRLTFLGLTGLREDHTLGNLAHVAQFCADGHPGLVVLTDHCTITPVCGAATFSSFARQQVSIFSFTPDVPVNAEGLVWPVVDMHLRWGWEATLNAAIGGRFSVSGGVLLVTQTHEAKDMA